METRSKPEWLESYATDRHDWRQTMQHGRLMHYRRIGIVEGLFNTDGIDYEGRADLTFDLHVEFKTSVTKRALRERILQAWAAFRQKHVLLSARIAQAKEVLPSISGRGAEEWFYVFQPSASLRELHSEAEKHIVFMEDHYPNSGNDEFFVHTLNCSRCVDPFSSLSRFYVMPLVSKGEGLYDARFVMTAGHEIVDGLTSMRWMSSFIDMLNRTPEQLRSDVEKSCLASVVPRLPPAQESLYPSMGNSPARERWAWAISRILRHTKKSPPASFQNPLRRRIPLSKAEPLPPKFSSVLDYSRVPPLNTYPVRPVLSAASSQRLANLCREARISIGSGCFALVALVMMLFEERRCPDIPAHERLPFVGSFPVNPRPLLDGTPTTGKEDNLMLAFSEGIALPFLTRDLDIEGRFRLLGKQAHRQLRQYQKRPRDAPAKAMLGSKSPEQLLPMLYLATMERLESKSEQGRKRGWNIQGEYPAKMGSTLATCGVSSVGPRGSIIASGKFNTRELIEGHDIAADFRELHTTVRARDGEFLVGAVGDNGILKFGVSYDGCAIDPILAEEWKQVMETILEPKPSSGSKL
ncbi:uncharacterized protein A1O9_02228 [Exophiala aquamarina CBS 119918]|uniref:Condensation domain-containing protein n=1 Tax=Exophiala aquamarina CBS 119918 TaxID=1182545 RepID=A0A072PLN6_9EURO|nr:uncharacterized protein A1O9_02228 [Exophiala aquamarina CBS 119918]KEF60667.1 hypothetical protein A1O9_02228 [Exophiala aquamarina CBS 119918]